MTRKQRTFVQTNQEHEVIEPNVVNERILNLDKGDFVYLLDVEGKRESIAIFQEAKISGIGDQARMVSFIKDCKGTLRTINPRYLEKVEPKVADCLRMQLRKKAAKGGN